VDSLGWAYFRNGNYKDALRYVERAVQLQPQDPVLNDHLGDVFWKLGRSAEARAQWEKTLTLNPEPEDASRLRSKLVEGLAEK
jgi:Flp pilus assembly protein TadD